MMVRLAFSVAIQVDADILLIDEVLAVGDAAFQQKCFDEFARIRKSDRTVLLVTHDMGAVQRFCDRAMLLEHGRLVDIGDTDRIGTRYLELNFSSDARAAEVEAAEAEAALAAEEAAREEAKRGKAPDEEPETPYEVGDAEAPAESSEPPAAAPAPEPEKLRYGNGKAKMVDGWFEDAGGRRAKMLRSGESCAFCVRTQFHDSVENPLLGVTLFNGLDHPVLGFNNVQLGAMGTFEAGDEVVFRIRFDNILVPGRYYVSPAVAHDGGGVHWLDYRKRWVSIVVSGTGGTTGALTEPPFELLLDRVDAGETSKVRSA